MWWFTVVDAAEKSPGWKRLFIITIIIITIIIIFVIVFYKYFRFYFACTGLSTF